MLIADLSSNNRTPDWRTLKSHGVNGVWLKASEGRSWPDSTDPWARNRYKWADAARAAGLRVGWYHFARPDNGNLASAEAENFCNAVDKIGRRDLRPVLDYERVRKTGQDEEWIRGWNHWVKERLGVGPLFYSYPYLVHQLALTKTVGYGLWLADYGRNDGGFHPYKVPLPWKKAAVVQYTSNGYLGSYGPVDLSLTFGLGALAHPVLGLV